MKVGHSRNATATVVVKAEWEKFVIEENLCNLIEGVNQTSISGMKHFFINIGGKERLRHRPIDQFNGRATRRQVGAYLSVRQRKLHKTLSETLLNQILSLHVVTGP
jgi:hypothetical protein